MRKKTLSINASAILLSTILLAKLIVELVNKKKKVEEIYLELICTIGIFLLCLVATVLLIKGKKERKKIERSDSSLSLDNSDEEVEKIEERQPLLKRSASCPGQLNNKTTSAEEVRDAAERIENTMVKEDKGKTDKYYNLTGQQLSVENFGQDESIIAITLSKNCSIKKCKNGKEIKSTKNSIIDDGDRYKPVDFSVNKVEKINDKGKKEDSYQFTFKFQSTQKDDVYIEINCETLNVYSGWKENNEKPVMQYFKDLEANDDFLIFLDVKEIFFGFLGRVLTFAQKIFPANDQGLSSVAGKDVYERFKLSLLKEQSSCYIGAKGKGVLGLLDKKFPIKDILVNNQLISKKQEVEQEHQNDVDQDIQVDGPTNQNVIVDEEMPDIPQLQNKEDKINLSNANSISSSPSTSSGIVSDEISTDDITTVESKKEEEDAQKQPIRKSSSVSSNKSFLGSKESIDSTGKPKKKLKEGVKNLIGKTKNVFIKKEKSEELIYGIKKEEKKFSFKKIKDKLTKKGKKTSPSSSIDTLSTESVEGKDNQNYVPD